MESVTDRVEPGSLSIANMLMNETTRSMVTGCCACRASCSLDDMAPTAANIAEYRRKPPMKYAHEDERGCGGHVGDLEDLPGIARRLGCPAGGCAARSSKRAGQTPQIRNWKMRHRPDAEDLAQHQLERPQ